VTTRLTHVSSHDEMKESVITEGEAGHWRVAYRVQLCTQLSPAAPVPRDMLCFPTRPHPAHAPQETARPPPSPKTPYVPRLRIVPLSAVGVTGDMMSLSVGSSGHDRRTGTLNQPMACALLPIACAQHSRM